MTTNHQPSEFEFDRDEAGEFVRILARGQVVLTDPTINRGSSFTADERRSLELNGLLPSRVMPLAMQAASAYRQYCAQHRPLAKYLFLQNTRNRDEVLFYKLLGEHLEEMLSIVDTPTVGQAIAEFSRQDQQPRGIYLSIDDPDSLERCLQAMGHHRDEVDIIAVTDSEAILGLGDQGVGGIAIVEGKLDVYTAAGGIHPHRVLPVVLDTGTDNLDLLSDDSYIGLRHARVRGARYDAFVERFVETATRLFPHALLHWEDVGASNAARILGRYQDDHCVFNDDLQATGAVALAALQSAFRITGESLADQRIVIHGAGTAGTGIAALLASAMTRQGLTAEEAHGRVWGLASHGLLREGISMRNFQEPLARSDRELASWRPEIVGRYELADVVHHVRPTVLIGCSSRPGAFTEPIVREMAAHCEHPVIMPLSNPTDRAEATPPDLIDWTDGRAMVVTGSPFAPVERGGVRHRIAQANNALVFPGIGLGVTAAGATRVSAGMITAAAHALSRAVDSHGPGAPLLPPLSGLRWVASAVGVAVAGAARDEGLATVDLDNPVQAVYDAMWRPEYPRIMTE